MSSDDAAWPPPPGGDATPPVAGWDAPTAARPAGLGPRVFARAIDFVTVGFLQLVVVLPFTLPRLIDELGGLENITDDVAAIEAAQERLSGTLLVAGIVGILITITYFVALETRFGTTLGKRLLGLRVRGPDGGTPSLEQAIKRNGWTVLNALPVVGSLLRFGVVVWIMVTIRGGEEHVGVHDRFADTRVVRA